MKKTTLFIVIISTFFLIGITLEERIVLYETRYTRNGVYERPFDMWYADTSLSAICISKKAPFKEAQEIARNILTKLNIVDRKYGLSTKLIVYIVDDESIDIPYRIGNSVIITLDAIEKESYDEALLSACLSCSEEWLLRGFKESLFGDKVNTAVLYEFYRNKYNTRNLNFTPWTFTEFFNKKYVEYAEDSAAYLIEFIEAEYGKSKLLELCNDPKNVEEILNSDYVNIKNEWLKSIGSKTSYTFEYDNFYESLFCVDKGKYLSIVGKDVRYDIYKDIFETIDDIDLFIYRNIKGRDKVREVIKEYGKDNRSIRLETDIHYSIQRVNNETLSLVSWMNPHGEALLDSEPSAHIHEAVHLYIATYLTPLSEIWLHEGVCEYFDILYGDYNKELYFSILTKSVSAYPGSLFAEVRKYYIEKGGKLSRKEFDYFLYTDALAYITLVNPDEARTYFMSLESVYDIDMGRNKNLTYPQAASLASYMVKNYSLENVLTICGNINSLESLTGKNYKEIHNDWINYLKP